MDALADVCLEIGQEEFLAVKGHRVVVRIVSRYSEYRRLYRKLSD